MPCRRRFIRIAADRYIAYPSTPAAPRPSPLDVRNLPRTFRAARARASAVGARCRSRLEQLPVLAWLPSTPSCGPWLDRTFAAAVTAHRSRLNCALKGLPWRRHTRGKMRSILNDRAAIAHRRTGNRPGIVQADALKEFSNDCVTPSRRSFRHRWTAHVCAAKDTSGAPAFAFLSFRAACPRQSAARCGGAAPGVGHGGAHPGCRREPPAASGRATWPASVVAPPVRKTLAL